MITRLTTVPIIALTRRNVEGAKKMPGTAAKPSKARRRMVKITPHF
jgi:hypothetical protein